MRGLVARRVESRIARRVLALGLGVALVLVGGALAFAQRSAAQSSGSAGGSPVGLWRFENAYPIYYRWTATSSGFSSRNVTAYKATNGCLVDVGWDTTYYTSFGNSSGLYGAIYRTFSAEKDGPGPDGTNCTRAWTPQATVKLTVSGNRMTESCSGKPSKVCYRYTRVASVPTGSGTTTSPPPTTTSPPQRPPTPPVDTSTKIEQGQSANVQCGSGNDGKSVFFEGDAIGLKRQHYLAPGNTLVIPIVISGGSGGGLMQWNFFRDGLGGTVSVDGCTLRYTAPTSCSCSSSSPSIGVYFADRTGRDGIAFHATLNVKVQFTAPPSLCDNEYLQVALPAGAWFFVTQLSSGRVWGPFFGPTTFQPVATGQWRVTINYASLYRGGFNEVVDIAVPRCSGAKVIR